MDSVLTFLGNYKKIFGIFGLLVVICAFTAAQDPDAFLQSGNVQNTLRWTALFGIIAIGVSFVIMTGGIDLSIGSVIGLLGCVLAMCLLASYAPEKSVLVTGADMRSRTLLLDSGGVFEPRDRISFLDSLYTVQSTDDEGPRIVVEETIESSQTTGEAFTVDQSRSVKVTAVDAANRVLNVDSGALFTRGDRLLFGDKQYTVSATGNASLVVAEKLSADTLSGQAMLAARCDQAATGGRGTAATWCRQDAETRDSAARQGRSGS